MPIPAFAIFLAGVIAAAWASWRAYRHLSELGRQRKLWVLFLGSAASPKYFTQEGERWRNRAVGFALGGIALALAVWFLVATYGPESLRRLTYR